MSCEYVRQYYGVPAEIGRRVTVNGKPGVIAADRGQYIGVNFDKDKPGVIRNCHPTWKVEYLDMGTFFHRVAPGEFRLEAAARSGTIAPVIDYIGNRGRKVSKKTKYRYCAYWGKWSRVLQWQDFTVDQVEVDLTPINSWRDEEWKKTQSIRIRKHCTSPGRRDRETDFLPLWVAKRMVKMLGRPIVERLLYEDFLSQIDWEKYERKCNGGVNFNDVLRDPTP